MPEPGGLIPPHGGYRRLRCYVLSEIIYDGTVAFTGRFLNARSRTVDQMVQAARSGAMNIAEGSRASATSKKTEIKLIGVARASLEELLLDYEGYLRQNGLELWHKDHEKAVFIRGLSRRHGGKRSDQTDPSDQSDQSASASEETYELYRPYIEQKSPETAANTIICLIHQANFLLDRLLKSLEKSFMEDGGFTERLYRVRKEERRRQGSSAPGDSGEPD